MFHFSTFNPRWFRPPATSGKNILYFDGVCGLCNHWVDFILEWDREGRIHFAPLQGEYAAKHLSSRFSSDLNTLVYEEQGQLYEKSDAVLKIFRQLGGIFAVFAVFRLLPRAFRNFLYDWMAVNRYRFFGKKDSCRMPMKEEKERFLTSASE